MDADNRRITNPLTGEPDAGNPPVRFGGRGGLRGNPIPISFYFQEVGRKVVLAEPLTAVAVSDGVVIAGTRQGLLRLQGDSLVSEPGAWLLAYWMGRFHGLYRRPQP